MSANNRIVSIVDGDPGTTIFFQEALRSIPGITVFTFTDPIFALEHFQDKGYAYVVVISDFKIPGLHGMEFLKKIKDSNRFVRTILMTGFELDNSLFQEYTKMKIINGFLQKPIGLHDLIKEVNTQLDSYEVQKNILPNGQIHIKYLQSCQGHNVRIRRVNFNTEHRNMLSNLHAVVSKDYLAIPEKFEKLITS
jgi:DNA-binding NtrC family response regulator